MATANLTKHKFTPLYDSVGKVNSLLSELIWKLLRLQTQISKNNIQHNNMLEANNKIKINK